MQPPQTPRGIVVGLDIGTTSTIAVALRAGGEILASASRPTTLSSPHPGWAEEDPNEWWSNSVAVLREITAGLPAAELAGLCVTGMLPALVLLDAEGRPIRPAIQQSDARCTAEVEALRQEVDETRFLARTGNGINQQLIAAKLLWVRRHEPENFARIGTVFGSYDYINWRLTGARRIEQNWALEAGFTDLSTHTIADDLVALAGIARSALPERSLSHERIGEVSAEAAAATGLPAGLPVFGGAADHIVSALAAGISRPGDVLLKFGGAGDIVVATDRALPDARLYLDYHLVPGLYAPNGCMASSGSALNWLAGLLAGAAPGTSPHAELDRQAAAIPAGSDGLICLPYFLGEKTPIHDPMARGAYVGLSLSHTSAHIWRATLEAVAFGFRHHVDVLEEIGHAPRRFIASDGGTRSALWMQIMADVLGQPLHLLGQSHGSAVGAALVAAIGAGLITDWADITGFAPMGRLVEPNPAAYALYSEAYSRYRALYGYLRPYFHRGA